MRTKSKKEVIIKGKIIGGERLLICIPLISSDRVSLIKDAIKLKNINPDIIEWRVDYFQYYKNIDEIIDSLIELNQIIGDIPLIFTLRHIMEGGQQNICDNERLEIIKKSLETGYVDMIDVEMENSKYFLNETKNLISENKVKLILSYHDFKLTPDKDFIINKIIKGENLGADISKVAFMPKSIDDVLILFNATNEIKKMTKIPIIAISMGEIGKISRLAGGLFGSDITFAAGTGISAQGQIPYLDLKNMMNFLYEVKNDK